MIWTGAVEPGSKDGVAQLATTFVKTSCSDKKSVYSAQDVMSC